ncbi:GvpL/GvpF family gas vesicle protein [Lentzea sp. NPDC006480]|uniref:GvpL/GvpF family gas vesicle protein n=1 Tax=Lentzea sp. NPDC006480 TaxID=3157176 RepID=UPI0033A73D30
MSLFLHGVVRASHRLPGESRFRLVALEDLAVVVSDRVENRALTDQEATAHLAGLCALLPGGPVLPLRIGTTAVDEAAARAAVLAFTAPVLRRHLDELDGLAELHVRLVFDEDTALHAVYREGTFTLAQGEQIVRDVVVWRRKQADELLAPVAARSVALLDTGEPTEELRALLVPLDHVGAVRAAVAALDGVTATCTGPLPAFHFLDLSPSQPASRWGW